MASFSVQRKRFAWGLGSTLLGATLLCVTLLCMTAPKLSAAPAAVRELSGTVSALGEISRTIAQEVLLEIPNSLKPVRIAYGAASLGYFETTNFKVEGGHLTIKLIPPTYKSPIEFFASSREKPGSQLERWHKVGEQQFVSPFPEEMQKLGAFQVTGKFSLPFLAMTTALAHKKARFSREPLINNFPFVVNANGEVVWAHFATHGQRLFNYHPVFKSLGNGTFGLLFYRNESYFEIIDAESGQITSALAPQTAKTPYVVHHDFIVSEDRKSLVTFGHVAGKFQDEKRRAREGKTLPRWFEDQRISGLGPLSALGSSIIKVNLLSNKATTLWNPFDHFSPSIELDFFRGAPLFDPGISFDAYEGLYLQRNKWVSWHEDDVHFDWNHANSIDHRPGVGFLISFRNNDKVFALSEDFSKVLWSAGHSEANTYRPRLEDESFSGQHHASWIDDETFLIFDNHSGQRKRAAKTFASRISIYRLNPSDRALDRLWTYRSDLKAGARGSAERLPNGNIIALFPISGRGGRDVVLEVSQSLKDHVAAMVLANGTHWTGYRVQPLSGIGRETFLGAKPLDTRVNEGSP